MKFKKMFFIISIVITVSMLFSACGLCSRLLAHVNNGTPEESGVMVLPVPDENSVESYPVDKEPVPVPVPSVPEAEDVVGDWVAVYREGDTIYTHSYTFHKDGTYTSGGGEYLHTSHHPDLFAGYEKGWQPAPMGFPYDSGTYTYSDGVIELTCYGSDYEEYDEPFISWIDISEYDGDTAVFVSRSEYHEGQPRVFLKNAEYDFFNVEELFEQAGVDYTP